MGHFNLVDDFYVNLKENEDELQQLVDQLFKFYENGEGAKLQVGKVFFMFFFRELLLCLSVGLAVLSAKQCVRL